MMLYIGNGFILGIPARNLTSVEVKLYGKDRLLSSGLYKEKQVTKPKEVNHGKRNQSTTPNTD
jgi:hypothetical protein